MRAAHPEPQAPFLRNCAEGIYWGDITPSDQSEIYKSDPHSITLGESTRLTWPAPAGVQGLSSNFDADDVSGWKEDYLSYKAEYKIKIRLALNDIYTAKCQVYISDPPDDGGGEEETSSVNKTEIRKPKQLSSLVR